MHSADGFGALLRQCRQAAGLSQREVADRAGVSLATVRDLEQGRTRRPQARSFEALITTVGGTDEAIAALRERAGEPPGTGGTGAVRVAVLGPLVVHRGSTELRLPGKRRAVLGRLALSANAVVSVAELVDLLWPVDPPAEPVSAIQAHVSRLRATLGPAAELEHSVGGYRLHLLEQNVDVLRFRRALDNARWLADRRPWDALALLEDGVRLWRGEPFADIPELLLHPLTVALADELTAATMLSADLALVLGVPERALPVVRVRAGEQPLHESIHARLIDLLAATGQQGAALAAFDDIRRRLRDHLGVDPGRELVAVQWRVLRQHRPAGTAPTATPAAAARAPRPAQLPPNPPCFVGRVAQVRLLQGMVNTTDGPQHRLAVVSGAGGVGKTALALHVAHAVRHRYPDGQLYLNLRGSHPGGHPLTSGQALHALLDTLTVAPQRIPPDVAAKSALFRSMTDGMRLLMLLDDAADADQVRPLIPADSRCLTLVTSRVDLAGLVAADDAYPLMLAPFAIDEARDMFVRRVGADRVAQEPAAVDEIIGRCAGLPLALAVAAARAVTRSDVGLSRLAGQLGAAVLAELSGDDAATDVRAVFSWSYRALDPGAARMFRLMGLVPGTDVSLAAAASLMATSVDEARRPLAELTRTHLVTEDVPGRFALHDLLRAYSQETVDTVEPSAERRAATRRLLDHYLHSAHTAAVRLTPRPDAIVCVPAAPGVVVETVADSRQALTWFACWQRTLVAALDLAERAGLPRHAWQLSWCLENYLQRRGQWHDMVVTWLAAMRAARLMDDAVAVADAGRGVAKAYVWLRRFDEADAHLRQALEQFRVLDDQHRQAHTELDLSLALERQGSFAEAASYAVEARRHFRAADDRQGEARALNMIGWCRAQLDDYADAVACCEEALSVFRATGDHAGYANTADSLGFACHRLGLTGEAITAYRDAIARWRIVGDRYGLAQSLVHLADAHADVGSIGDAFDAWHDGLAILDDLGHPEAADVRRKVDAHRNGATRHP